MVALRVHKDFQLVRHLPFCYVCGRQFVESDETDGGHVPPKTAFNPRDRQLTLKLETHKGCNHAFSVEDKKIGQLIALRRLEGPKSARDYALQFVHHASLDMVSLENLNIDLAIWRWVRGFHAALYRQPLTGNTCSIQTPFPRGENRYGRIVVRPILKQHTLAVAAIKRNRVSGNLDSVVSNNGKLRYECVWCQADDGEAWICAFGLDIYDWKDLGSHANGIPARGCVGIYALADRSAPDTASRDLASRILVPNIDTLDAFAP